MDAAGAPAEEARLRGLRGLRGAAARADEAGCFFARLPVFRFAVADFFTRDLPRIRQGPEPPLGGPDCDFKE